MAREFARDFYNSVEWKLCRKSYIDSMPIDRRGLCEKCFAEGKHVLGKELHHKIFLTPSNIKDRNISLNHNNLILLCKDCHKKMHEAKDKRPYTFDEFGNLIKR